MGWPFGSWAHISGRVGRTSRASAHWTLHCSRLLAQFLWDAKHLAGWRSVQVTRPPPLADTRLCACPPHQATGSQTGNRKRRSSRKRPECLPQRHRPAPAREAVFQPRPIDRGSRAVGLLRLRLCKAQDPALGVRDECQTERLHHPHKSRAGAG